MDGTRRAASSASLRALDALNVFLADVRDGLGPYLAIYLTMRHWDKGHIGIAMSAMGFASVLAQTPAGAFIDRTRHKRLAIAIAALAVAIGAVAMVQHPTFATILGAQALMGVASVIFAPAIAAVTLGLVGHVCFSRRTGRNEAFNHAGNVMAAVLAMIIGDSIAYEGIFYLLAGMCVLTIVATRFIRPDEIDHDLARGADDDHQATDERGGPEAAGQPRIAKLGELLGDRRILVFSAAVVLFHLANAAMLPLAGQKLSDGHDEGAAGYMSACIIAAQLVMVPVALLASRLAVSWGRRPVFLIGFAVLPIRGMLYTMTTSPYGLVAIQLLDGIGAGIFGVVGVLVIADLTRGTGRFNLLQGALATATGIGASLSNLMTGYVVKAGGYDVGFLVLSTIAAVALGFFGLAMPETRVEPHPAVESAGLLARAALAVDPPA
ncbi:MAG: MFS transporter [Isosphaeraceae bacterium]